MAKSYPRMTYADDGGAVHPIRMELGDQTAQPTTAAAGTVTSSISARISGSRRRIGLGARYVNLTRSATAGTGAGIVTRSYSDRLAILKLADFTALNKGGTITVNGVVWTISSKQAEVSK